MNSIQTKAPTERRRRKDSPELTVVKAELLKLKLTNSDLAARTGYSISTINDFMAGFKKSKRMARKIEEVIGFPVWTSPVEWARRN